MLWQDKVPQYPHGCLLKQWFKEFWGISPNSKPFSAISLSVIDSLHAPFLPRWESLYDEMSFKFTIWNLGYMGPGPSRVSLETVGTGRCVWEAPPVSLGGGGWRGGSQLPRSEDLAGTKTGLRLLQLVKAAVLGVSAGLCARGSKKMSCFSEELAPCLQLLNGSLGFPMQELETFGWMCIGCPRSLGSRKWSTRNSPRIQRKESDSLNW